MLLSSGQKKVVKKGRMRQKPSIFCNDGILRTSHDASNLFLLLLLLLLEAFWWVTLLIHDILLVVLVILLLLEVLILWLLMVNPLPLKTQFRY